MEMPLNDTLSKSSTSGASAERTLRPGVEPAQAVGALLKRQREAKLMSLAEVSRVTRIPLHTLESIEKDRFDDLPGEVFIRGFLKSYARAVGATPQDVIARYASSRRVATVNPLPVASPVQAASEGQGRRFGVAIAFVLLLILFTLALSIVLKPRGRDMPPELSLGEPAAAVVDGRG
jgi:cytoskeletal protein RodZ